MCNWSRQLKRSVLAIYLCQYGHSFRNQIEFEAIVALFPHPVVGDGPNRGDRNEIDAPFDFVASHDGGIFMANILPQGAVAPEFSLHVTPDQKLSLSELRGRPVILAFYPADWSPVCGDQMALYNEILPDFQKYRAELIGISVDGVWCHAAFAKDRNLHFPLAADFEPKGQVSRAYGVYRSEDGVCERALFVIDKNGAIAWSYCSPIAVNPGAEGILQALENLPK
jgi:peroxiredoxin